MGTGFTAHRSRARAGILVVCIAGVASRGAGQTASLQPADASRQLPETPKLIVVAPAPESSDAAPVVVQALPDPIVINLAAMVVRPLIAGASTAPAGLATGVGNGGAFMSVTAEVVAPNTIAGFVASNFLPGETVNLYVNGNLASYLTADADGRQARLFNTGGSTGLITLELIGETSGRRAAGVVEVAAVGPFLPGFAVAPHAIKSNGSGIIQVLGTGYPQGPVTLSRNGVAIAGLTAGPTGTFSALVGVAVGPDSSAVYTADTGANDMVGQSIEERNDAGTPPIGDQNIARAYVDRAVGPTSGWAVTVVGEGFVSGETVDMSCGPVSGLADGNGSVGFALSYSGSGTFQCVMTGAMSGRIARLSFRLDSHAPPAIRGMIVRPSVAPPGGGPIVVFVDRLTPSDPGGLYLDGVLQLTTMSDPFGYVIAAIPKPTTRFLHTVEWRSTGSGERSSTVFMLTNELLRQTFDNVTPPELPPGWVTSNSGSGVFWVTDSGADDTPANAAFTPNPTIIGIANLRSLLIPVSTPSVLRFRNLFNLENGFDGMVLEISISGGPFEDILTAGGSFLTGGYIDAISLFFGNPFAGRQAWTGLSAGTTAAPAFITTVVNLPASAVGHHVQLRWRVGTDSNLSAVGAAGARIDSVTLITNTAGGFADDPLIPATTPIKAIHILQLRARIDAARARWGLGPYPYSDPMLPVDSTLVKADHISDLRAALAGAYAAAALPLPGYTDAALGSGIPIRGVDIVELRSYVVALGF